MKIRATMPGGMEVTLPGNGMQILAGLVEKYGVPREKPVNSPARFVEDGYEYHTFRDDAGRVVTTIKPYIEKKCKK